MTLNDNSIFYRRNLPHYQPPNAIFFITSRLADSLPWKVIQVLKGRLVCEEQRVMKAQDGIFRARKLAQLRNHYFRELDSMLDKVLCGPTWLGQDAVARIAADTMLSFDKIRYNLICFTIMPNHIHLIADLNVEGVSVRPDTARLTQNNKYALTSIMRLIKGRSAFQANGALNRRGTFWQHESYDHVIRSEGELERTVEYVLNNPVKAGLAKNWWDWKWSYVMNSL